MHEPLLSNAAMPQTPRIFRVSLRPYSLGHELHLHRRSSPFVTKTYGEICAMSRPEKLAATMQAVEVCSRDFAGNFTPARHWGLWRRYCEWCDLKAAVQSFWGYITEGHAAFESELPSGEGYTTRVIGAPEALRLYQFVCATLPRREIALYSTRKRATAWDYPFALATMMKQSASESAGELSIYNWTNKALDDYAAQREAEKAAEKEKCQTH